MSIISKKCDKCGSTEHIIEDCPHSLFSNECSKCGSKEHSLENCPHNFFSNECPKCGSKEHNLENCPHIFLNNKCTKCGSTEHTIQNCPHNFFNNSCENCGSKNHSTTDCPHHLWNQPAKQYKSTYQAPSSSSSGNEYAWIGYIIGFVVLVGLAIIVIGTAITVALSILFTLILMLPTLIVAYDFWRKKDKEIEHKYFKFLNFFKKPSFELPFLFVSVILGLYLAFVDGYLLRLNSLHRNLMSNFHIGDITFYLHLINLIAVCFVLYLLVKHYITKSKGEEEFQQKQTVIQVGIGILSALILGWYCFGNTMLSSINSNKSATAIDNVNNSEGSTNQINVSESNNKNIEKSFNIEPIAENQLLPAENIFYSLTSYNRQATFLQFDETKKEGIIVINGNVVKLNEYEHLNPDSKDHIFKGDDVVVKVKNVQWNQDGEGDCSEGSSNEVKVIFKGSKRVLEENFWFSKCAF